MSKNLLIEIKSKYIIQNIFLCIEDNIKYKLVKYSKYGQRKLDIKLVDYEKIYYYYKNMFKIFWPNYLCFHNYIEGPGKENDIHEEYDSIYLKKKLINQLSENNLVYGDYWFKKSLIKFFKNYIKENNFIEIDLYSPIFNFLLNQKNFISRFIIQIPLYRFKDFNSSKLDLIKSDFINNLNKIKKSDINYSLACIDINDIDYLKHLKIDKNSIISLKLYLLNINDNGASYNLQNKFHESFPNLTNLTIIIKNRYFYTANITNISDLKIFFYF